MKKVLVLASIILFIGAGCSRAAATIATPESTSAKTDIQNFLAYNSQHITNIIEGDFNDNNVPDQLVTAEADVCVSCETKYFYIFENKKVLYQMSVGTTEPLSVSHGVIKFREAVYAKGEPACCPSMTKILTITCATGNQKGGSCEVSETKPESIK